MRFLEGTSTLNPETPPVDKLFPGCAEIETRDNSSDKTARSTDMELPEVTTYKGADALAMVHRIRCERAECFFCDLIKDSGRKVKPVSDETVQ